MVAGKQRDEGAVRAQRLRVFTPALTAQTVARKFGLLMSCTIDYLIRAELLIRKSSAPFYTQTFPCP